MAQYVINIGALPNDGTGDPLRTAFNETNLNFNQVFAAGPVLSNVRIANNTILTTTTNGNLILAPNGIGRIQANATVVPSVANVRDLGSTDRRWNTIYSQYLDISAPVSLTDLTVTGNLTVIGNTIQIGNIVTDTKTIQLANTAVTANAASGSGITVGANDAIATMLYSSANNAWTFNIGVDTPNIVVNNISSDDSTFVTIQDGLDVQGDITAEIISVTGNVTANYFIGNGSQLTGVSNYSNANAVAYGQAGWAGNIIPAANVTYSLGNSTNYWSNLWVANNTIYIGGVALGMTAGNVLTVNGNAVLTNGSNTAVSTTGNITAGNIGITGGSLAWANASIVQTSASDVSITGDGQVTVRSLDGTYQWTFDSNGNLTAPGNVSATGNISGNYFVGNGSQLTGISAGANTGNVTFNDVNIIGDGNLRLQPDPANASAYLDIYLTAGPDIHIAGNGETVILGTDDFANVTVNVDGNVSIQASNGTPHTWTFDTAGNLNLPGNTIAINYADGNLAFGTVTFNNEAVIGTGTSNTQSGLYLAPDPVSLTNDLYLRVRGNILDEPTHIHFDTGNNQYYNLIIGDDNKYVQLANTGNIVINTNNYAGNSAQWNFDTAGNLTVPGGMIINGNINTLGSQTALLQPTDDLPLAFIASGANGSVISYWAEDIANLMTSNIAAIYTPLQNTQTVRIVTGSNGGNIAIYDFDKDGVFTTAQVSATGNVTGNYFIGNGSLLTGISASLPVANGTSNFDIATANGNATITANSASTWTFGTDSALTLPASSGQIGRSGYPNGIDLYNNNGGTGYVRMNYADESLISADSGGAHVQTTGGTWDFDTTGNLTAPGNISAVGNITSGNLTVGSGTITGGNVNGSIFNGNVAFGTGTVGGSGNITGGNLITSGSGGNITMSGGNITGALRVVTTPTALANLTAVAGGRAFVNNANLVAAGNFGNQVGSGGSNVVPVWSDGSNWYIG